MAQNRYNRRVFFNCPFDAQYRPLFEAIVFAVLACGFRPRCALEIDDASEVRIDKIFKIIAACKYGVHDVSRTELTSASGLPRFNMPLELGMFLAAKRFGAGRQKQKVCLVLDSMPYRYRVQSLHSLRLCGNRDGSAWCLPITCRCQRGRLGAGNQVGLVRLLPNAT